MFYWPLSSAAFGISSSIFAGIIVAIWLYSKFWDIYDDNDESEDSFELDDIGFFLNTDTESVTTNREESTVQHDGGNQVTCKILSATSVVIIEEMVEKLVRLGPVVSRRHVDSFNCAS